VERSCRAHPQAEPYPRVVGERFMDVGARDGSGASVRLLIAEDEDMFAELIEVLVSQDGIELVGRARDGREAVELAERLQPDVVVMDIGMPLLDGLEATRRVAKRDPRVRVVIFTSSDDERDVDRAREVGAAAYVQKAHVDAVLLSAIRRAAAQQDSAPTIEREMRALDAAPAFP
jgi:DNA-binding NarL/FixJ family response regulator